MNIPEVLVDNAVRILIGKGQHAAAGVLDPARSPGCRGAARR